jgi:hypothetical protein
MTDLSVQNHGTIFILTPTSPLGHDWVAEHIPEDATRWGRCSIVVEHRFIGDIIEGASADGLSIMGD